MPKNQLKKIIEQLYIKTDVNSKKYSVITVRSLLEEITLPYATVWVTAHTL